MGKIYFKPISTPGIVALFVAYWLAIQHTALCAVPTATRMSLARGFCTPNISIGEKIYMTVMADFPAGDTNNVTIEILSSLNDTFLAFVKVVSSNMGNNLRLDPGKKALLDNPVLYPGKEYVNAVKVRYNTHAVIDLGTVTNNGSNINLTDSQISITYEVVMVSNAGLGTGAVYWTIVGMMYNSNKYVWVSQVNNTLNNTIKSSFLTYIYPLCSPPYKDNMPRTMHKEVEIMQ